LTPGSGLSLFRISDLQPIRISESLKATFWAKNKSSLTFFPVSVKKLNNFQFCEIDGYKKGKNKKFPLFFRDGEKIKIRDQSGINISDPQHANGAKKALKNCVTVKIYRQYNRKACFRMFPRNGLNNTIRFKL
jgi:hypothetical protein